MWSLVISVRICALSFASRLESGSSRRNTFGFADDCAAERDALLLTARKRLRLSRKVHLDTQNARGFLDADVDLLFGHLSQFQTERHVVVNGHVRIQRVVLEHHRDIPVFRRDVVDQAAVDVEFAVRNFFQPRDHAEGGGFTAAGRPDEDDKFLIFDIQIEIRYGGDAGRINFIDVLQLQTCHFGTNSSRMFLP